MSSFLTSLTKDIGDAFKNVSPILEATGVVKQNNANAQPPVTNPVQSQIVAGVNNTTLLAIAGGGVLVLLIVVLLVRRK